MTEGSQYTSQIYREAVCKYGIHQSMNSAGGRCHDNARCESMWARMKSELLYDRYDTEKMTTDELRTLSGDISSATGITGESALPMEDFPQWSNDSNTIIPRRKPHRIQNP